MQRLSDRLILVGVFTSTWGYFRFYGIPIGYLIASAGVLFGLLTPKVDFIDLGFPFFYLLLLLTFTTFLRLALPPSNTFLNNQSQLIATGSGATREYTDSNWFNLTINSYLRWALSILLAIMVCRHLFIRSGICNETFFIFWHMGISVNVFYAILEKFHVAPNLLVFSTTSSQNLRYSGFTVQPNILGSIALLAIPFAFIPVSKNRKMGRLIANVEILILSYGILVCGSRISLVLLPFAILIPYWLPYRGKKLDAGKIFFSVSFTLSIFFFILIFQPNSGWFSENRFSAANGAAVQSTAGRLSLYKGTLQNLVENPFFGYGPAINKDAHSAYLQIASCLGLQGAIMLVWIIMSAIFPKNFVFLYKNVWFRSASLATILFWTNNLVNNGLTEFYAYFPIIFLIYEAKKLDQIGFISGLNSKHT